MNKAILLCRVSTDVQDYDAQISDLKKYAQSKGITESYVIATKESGFKNISEREGWIKTKEYFELHPDFDTLIVTEISRLGRRETAIAEIKEYMEKNKKSLYIKDNDLFLYDKGKKQVSTDIVFNVLASLAVNEMSVKKDRFMRSRRELTEQGFSIVGKVLFGYKRVRDEVKRKNKFVVNRKEASEINELYNIYLYGLNGKDIGIKGLTLYAITKGMSKYLHSKRNMVKLLGEKAYIGGIKEVRIKRRNPEYWKFNDHTKPTHIETISHIPYPKILNENLFNDVQKKKKENRILVDKSVKHNTILSKLIECPSCHNFLIGDYRRDRKTATYRCGKHKGEIGKCSNSSIISMSYIDSLVWCYLKTNVKKIIEEIYKKNYDVNISNIENEIFNCQEKKKELQEEVKTESIIFKNQVKILGLNEAQKRYDNVVSKIEKQVKDIDNIIEGHNKRITEIKNISSYELTDEDMEKVESDKDKISEYIHLLVKKILCWNYKTLTYIRVILNGDDDRTFRFIIANKRDTNRIKVFGFKKEKDMLFKMGKKEIETKDGEMDWEYNDFEVLEKMLLLKDDIELYPIEFKRLEVYDEDMK